MLTYHLNDPTIPLYEQLYDCIKQDIINGQLKAGDKLPSKRSLSKQLNISIITIETTYLQLMDEGYIYSKARSGYYVADLNIPSPSTSPLADNSLKNEIHESYRYDFSSSRTISDNFPFTTWAKLTRELLSAHREELMMNAPAQGTTALRAQIAHHLHDFHDLNVSIDQIVIGAGTEYLYGLLIQLLGFDQIYGIERPGYQKLRQIYQSYHITFDDLPMDQNGVIIENLEKQNINILHISPSHHFPTGITMPMKRRYELLQWALKDDHHYIIEDEYDSEFRMTGKPIPSLFSIDHHEKVIYMNTFSRKLASTIRISYMVLPLHLARRFKKQLDFYSCTVSTFEQLTLARFIETGAFEKHLNRLRNTYRHKQRRMLEIIAQSPLQDHVHISQEHTGLHFLMTIDYKGSLSDFQKKLKAASIHLSCMSEYGSDDEHTFIISYASMPEEHFQKAIEALNQVIIDT